MLNDVVSNLLKKYTGGKQFFDALDAVIRENDQIMADIHGLIKDPHRYTFILAGDFGRKFLNWMIRTSKPFQGYIVFPGGMGDGKQRQHLYSLFKDETNWARKACFVDDSFYSGTTRETCIKRLAVPHDVESYVAYDGSITAYSWLTSLYRYHPTV